MTIDGPAPIVSSINVHPTTPGVQTSPPAREVAPPVSDSVDAPDGVDPALWQLLTPAEQSYFAAKSVLGPLTYEPTSDVKVQEAPRGQRIDVRA